MRVKICGITRAEDAEMAVELGASAIGFVFWPRSPRTVTPAQARAIVARLPAFVTSVGVFVDELRARVDEVADLVGLDAVQLHGDETVAYVTGVRHRVIRSIGVRDAASLARVGDWPPEVTLLLDAYDPERRGGTGQTVDWTAAAGVAAVRRTILSGGLRPENVAEAIDRVRPYAVDVSSGIESKPGIKDGARMQAFFQAVRGTGV